MWSTDGLWPSASAAVLLLAASSVSSAELTMRPTWDAGVSTNFFNVGTASLVCFVLATISAVTAAMSSCFYPSGVMLCVGGGAGLACLFSTSPLRRDS